MAFNLKNIPAPCSQRAKIYETYLESVYDQLQNMKGTHAFSQMKSAFDDKSLLKDLAEILDEYVICGVAADLDRCRDKLASEQPNNDLSKLIDLDKPISPTIGKANLIADDRTAIIAYDNYFNWFILPQQVKQNGKDLSGIRAFFERYPMVEHAVETMRDHFIHNIQEACDRLAKDWRHIHSIFFPKVKKPKLTQLYQIITTGSDFHKGGKQVLILKFQTTAGFRKLIYKPGDIELDYHLLANTDGIRTQQNWGLGSEKSIVEITNEFLDDDFKLPTYRIFPRNPGSQLKMVDNRLPISDSYGYIEFLSNAPKADNWGNPQDWKPDTQSDWVTEQQADVHRFYRQWGRFLAMGQLFSMSDFHLDNVIVHSLQPHLIDAEISFTGPMDDVTDTLAFNAGTGSLGSIKNQSPQSKRDRSNPQNANLYLAEGAAMVGHVPAKNRLYLSSNLRIQKVDVRSNVLHLIKGYMEATGAYVDKSNREKLISWLNRRNIQHVIARFTPKETPYFAQLLRMLYQPKFCSESVPKRRVDFDREPFRMFRDNIIKEWTDALQEPDHKKWPKPRPNYAIMNSDHVFKDLLDCDIPAFYHQLNGHELLNSRGEAVLVRPTPDGSSIDRASYYKTTAWTEVLNQIKSLETNTDSYVRESIDKMLSHLGVDKGSVSETLDKWFHGDPIEI